MPRDQGSPASWLLFAHSDLALAIQGEASEILYETLCFHAQQAVEKALKAVLIHFGIPAPKMHSIEHLVDVLPQSIERTSLLLASAKLTDYAVVFRYPGDEEPVNEQDYTEAVHIASEIVK